MNTRLFVVSALSFFIFGTLLLTRLFDEKFWKPVKRNNSMLIDQLNHRKNRPVIRGHGLI